VIAAFFGADESVAGRFIEGLNYSEMLHCRGLPCEGGRELAALG
jgi:hypothetical protein